MNGVLFTQGPIDDHYHTVSDIDPYKKVNAPKHITPMGLIKSYANHVFNGKQNVDNAGWQQNSPQQRTSYLRMTALPSGSSGYAPATSVPKPQPQQPRTQRFLPTIGSDQPGAVRGQSVILNSTTFGAGQTAGGIGGNNYTPPVPGPDTTPVAATNGSQPMWG
jgi:hypothetical protein